MLFGGFRDQWCSKHLPSHHRDEIFVPLRGNQLPGNKTHSKWNGYLPSLDRTPCLGWRQGSIFICPRYVSGSPCGLRAFVLSLNSWSMLACEKTRSCAHTKLSLVWGCCAGGQLKLFGSSKSVHRLSRASARCSGARPLAANAPDGVGEDKRVRLAAGLEEEVQLLSGFLQHGHSSLHFKCRNLPSVGQTYHCTSTERAHYKSSLSSIWAQSPILVGCGRRHLCQGVYGFCLEVCNTCTAVD